MEESSFGIFYISTLSWNTSTPSPHGKDGIEGNAAMKFMERTTKGYISNVQGFQDSCGIKKITEKAIKLKEKAIKLKETHRKWSLGRKIRRNRKKK